MLQVLICKPPQKGELAATSDINWRRMGYTEPFKVQTADHKGQEIAVE
jgi:hypothetical protein